MSLVSGRSPLSGSQRVILVWLWGKQGSLLLSRGISFSKCLFSLLPSTWEPFYVCLTLWLFTQGSFDKIAKPALTTCCSQKAGSRFPLAPRCLVPPLLTNSLAFDALVSQFRSIHFILLVSFLWVEGFTKHREPRAHCHRKKKFSKSASPFFFLPDPCAWLLTFLSWM